MNWSGCGLLKLQINAATGWNGKEMGKGETQRKDQNASARSGREVQPVPFILDNFQHKSPSNHVAPFEPDFYGFFAFGLAGYGWLTSVVVVQ
jgi:hypothetical protein